MCVAIYKPLGKVLTRKDLNDAWDTNPDGGGLAWRTSLDGDITIDKGYMSKKPWVKAVMDIGPDAEMLIHARIATHGKKSAEMTHPFQISTGGCWIHNGMISGYPRDRAESDTWFFTQEFVNTALEDYPDFFMKEYARKMMAELLSPSKGMFMLPGQEVVILNQHLCTDDNGIWLSNTHFRKTYTSWTNNKAPWSDPNMEWDYQKRMYVPKKTKAVIALPAKPAEIDWYDPDYMKQWEDELAESEHMDNDPIDCTAPLSAEERRMLAELTNDERALMEQDRKAHTQQCVGIVDTAENVTDLPLFVYVNGKPIPYAEYKKLTVIEAQQKGV